MNTVQKAQKLEDSI